MSESEAFVLRGHHLGCVLAGLRSGSQHPTVPHAMAWLRSHPQGTVEVVVGPDDICVPCPNWDGTACKKGFEEMNKGKDARFLDMLGMKDGEGMPARDLFERFMSRADAQFFRSVCGGCHADSCAKACQGSAPF